MKAHALIFSNSENIYIYVGFFPDLMTSTYVAVNMIPKLYVVFIVHDVYSLLFQI